MDSPAIHQSRNYFKIPRGVSAGLEQSMGLGGSERNAPFMLQTSQPRSPSWVSSQGMKSGKDSQISRPVGALIKLRGSHSRIHMVSETVPFSAHFCLLLCVAGQRAAFTHFCSHHCGEAATSVVGRVGVPLQQEHSPAVPHLLPDCPLFALTCTFPRPGPPPGIRLKGGCQSGVVNSP